MSSASPVITSAKITLLEGEVDGVRRVEIAAVQHPLLLVGAARIIEITESGAILSDVLVHPDLRRLGIGTLLVRAAKTWTDQCGLDLYLHVKPDNPALQLYLAEGFEDFYGQKTEEGSLWLISVAHEGRLHREEVANG